MTHEALLAYLHMVGCERAVAAEPLRSAVYPSRNGVSPFSMYWYPHRSKIAYTVYTNDATSILAEPKDVFLIARQAITQYLQEKP